MMRDIKINKDKIGKNKPCYIVAELSGNHGGNFNEILKLIKLAKDAGANAIKLQAYTPDTITLNSKKKDFQIYKKHTWSKYKDFYSLYKSAHTPLKWIRKIFLYCRKKKITVFASVFDFSSVDLLEKLNCPAYKIASPEITDVPLLKYVAKKNKPIIISTGLAKLQDLNLAIRTIRKQQNNKIIILKCTSAYPAKLNEINLKTMMALRKKFKCHVGYSDHTLGISVAIAASALGANIIEKHIKSSKSIKTVDSFFSITIEEFRQMIKSIRDNEKAYGKISFNISKGSTKNLIGKRSLYVSEKIKKGNKFTKNNIRSVRPFYGLHPKYYDKVIGMKSKKNLQIGDRLTFKSIQTVSKNKK